MPAKSGLETPARAEWRRSPAFTLPLALLLMVSSCGDDSGGPGRRGAAAADATVAWRDTISVRATSVGSLDADKIVELRSETEGVVQRILADEGERVEVGELLVQLDARELRARYEAAQATLERTRAEERNLGIRVERNRDLLEEGAISPQAFDDLQTNYELAQARAEEARANVAVARRLLDQTEIRAPFAGTVGGRSFYIGDLIDRGSMLYTIVDDDTLKVEFSIPERYAGDVERGSPVSVQVGSLPSDRFRGSVTFVSPLVERESRTITVKAVIPNPEGRLRAGQFADVELALQRRRDAVLLPETAIVPRSGQNFVFLVRADTARRREVRIGERRWGLVELRSGVEAGDTVVVAGQQRLQDGSPVQLSIRDPEAWRQRFDRRESAEPELEAELMPGADAAGREETNGNEGE